MGGEGVEAGEEGGLGWEGGVEGAGCSWWVVLCSAHARTLKEDQDKWIHDRACVCSVMFFPPSSVFVS